MKEKLSQEELEKMNFCQSCGMVMQHDDSKYGTNKDGSKNSEYCYYCYEGGAFTTDDTMESMIEMVAKPTADALGLEVEEAKKELFAFFPTLKRWQ
ncbi:hypothetical protein OKW23_001279 [Bacilli bacterium PM5-9]|nr:hypothetical protein [Bacilli bacterium PM5-9]